MLSQPERLIALLRSTQHPVQFVFAGKAHPADDAGKEMIRQIVSFAADHGIRHRFVFLPDYDIAVARAMYHGADIWLNTPRRPQEACGTSGMKAALNGGLNCSILDGWWDEMFDGENGWAITSAEHVEHLERRDEIEANSVFDLLENQIVPLFYDRYGGPLPRRWLARVKHDLASLGPQVVASRMVRDYTEELYEPTAARAEALAADGYARAKTLAAYKARVTAAWPGVKIESVETDDTVAALGTSRPVVVTVSLGDLSVDDAEVQLVHGPVGPHDELDGDATVLPLAADDPDVRPATYRGEIPLDRPGRYGFTVRVVPSNPDLVTKTELGRIAWA
jgi:starch phosphorylase